MGAEDATLQQLLEREGACCLRLQAILDAERTAAASYDHAALIACLKERESMQGEWQRAANLRRRRLRETGTPLAALTARDPGLARALADTRRQAVAVRRAQRVNEALVRAVLTQVNDLLTTLARERPDSRYDGRAALTTAQRLSAGGSWSA